MRRPDRRVRGRRGFTLIELVAALALSGLAIMGAARLMHQLGDSADRAGQLGDAHARQLNGPRLLRDLVHNAEASVDSSRRFSGADLSAQFSSWCVAPSGWQERCNVRLQLSGSRDSSTLVATLTDGSTLTLWRGAGAAELRYYSGAGADGRWWRGWGTSVALPRAIGIVAGTDTMVLRIGAGT